MNIRVQTFRPIVAEAKGANCVYNNEIVGKVINIIDDFTVLHEKKPTNIINVRVVVNVGAIAESKSEYGVAHYLEHMFFKGTSKHNYKEINRITAELGDINAFTGRDMTVFHITS